MKSIFRYGMFMVISVSCVGAALADALSSDSANTMTCGTNFISVGDSEDAVLNQCGEPSLKEGDRWTYSGVQGSFIYQLTFGGGNVVSIHTRAAD
jgi:hypothetical protein